MPPWAGIVVAIVSAIVFPAIGLAVSWGALGQRIRAFEEKVAELKPLLQQVANLETRTKDSAESQGARIGKAQADVDKLVGKFEGLERLVEIAVRRTRTAAHGNKVAGG